MRYLCVVAATVVTTALCAAPAQAQFKSRGLVHHHYPAGSFMVGPQGVANSQGLAQWLPLFQMGMQFLDARFFQNPPPGQQPTPPPAVCTVPASIITQLDNNNKTLADILKNHPTDNPGKVKTR